MIDVVPAIIPQSLAHLAGELEKIRGIARRAQIDIADGAFAPSITWPYTDPDSFTKIVRGDDEFPHASDFVFELDMMIEEPEHQAEHWLSAGMNALILHVGSSRRIPDIIKLIRERGRFVGLATTPSADAVDFDALIPDVDFVQLMGNDRIGYHGVSLDERVYERAQTLRKQYPKLPIAVDIGVNMETAPKLIEAGVTKLVAGSAIFGASDIKDAYNRMKALG